METQTAIKNANHTNTLELVTPIEKICFYNTSAYTIFHDFIIMSGRGWLFPKNSPFAKFLAFNQGFFQARCFEQASDLIENYTGEIWKMNKNGIYCIDSKKSDRYTLNSPNYTTAECNALEAGLVVTIFALDVMMRHSNNEFASAMCFYREYLITLIKDQTKLEKTVIDSEKILKLID